MCIASQKGAWIPIDRFICSVIVFAKLEFENSGSKKFPFDLLFFFFQKIGLNSALSPLYFINVIIITAMLVMLITLILVTKK